MGNIGSHVWTLPRVGGDIKRCTERVDFSSLPRYIQSGHRSGDCEAEEFINRDEYYWFTRDTPGSALSTHMPMRIYVLMLLIHNSLLPFIDIGLSHA